MELIRFVFSDFWVFLGSLILLLVLSSTVVLIVSRICKTIAHRDERG